ncbi:DUF1440 domain-containing protein [Acidithiobacillus caldus]|uniref:DUF1440 domain-containing protein n=1 Tax=Acidithiobacillus caldus TaxID=33059 RepID=UPI001C075DE4|nr:DUF1440 domain-containing protein [Acidithiobacillus caldus]MBU2764396.1 DUF1440 domain-containing protein [Acidithiobacillus caldus]
MNCTNKNLGSGLIAGLAATIVLSALMIVKGMMGVMPALNVIAMLTTMANQYMGTPLTPLVGWILHFTIGTIAWGILFALFADRLPGTSYVVKGMVFGTLAWLAMMVMIMPLAGAGFFGLGLGLIAPVTTWMLHLVFGAVLGGVYGALVSRCQAKPAAQGNVRGNAS